MNDIRRSRQGCCRASKKRLRASTLPPFRQMPTASASPAHSPHGPRRHEQTATGPRTAPPPAAADYFLCNPMMTFQKLTGR